MLRAWSINLSLLKKMLIIVILHDSIISIATNPPLLAYSADETLNPRNFLVHEKVGEDRIHN